MSDSQTIEKPLPAQTNRRVQEAESYPPPAGDSLPARGHALRRLAMSAPQDDCPLMRRGHAMDVRLSRPDHDRRTGPRSANWRVSGIWISAPVLFAFSCGGACAGKTAKSQRLAWMSFRRRCASAGRRRRSGWWSWRSLAMARQPIERPRRGSNPSGLTSSRSRTACCAPGGRNHGGGRSLRLARRARPRRGDQGKDTAAGELPQRDRPRSDQARLQSRGLPRLPARQGWASSSRCWASSPKATTRRSSRVQSGAG